MVAKVKGPGLRGKTNRCHLPGDKNPLIERCLELRIAQPYGQNFSGHKSHMLNGKLIMAQISQCTKTQNPVEMRIKKQKQEAGHSLY